MFLSLLIIIHGTFLTVLQSVQEFFFIQIAANTLNVVNLRICCLKKLQLSATIFYAYSLGRIDVWLSFTSYILKAPETVVVKIDVKEF